MKTLLAIGLTLLTHIATAQTATHPAEYFDVNFGTVPVNQEMFQSWHITNTGKTAMTLKAAGIQGTFSFRAEDNCSTLAPQASCEVQISFWPTRPGYVTSRLILAFDTEDMIFNLNGWGQ